GFTARRSRGCGTRATCRTWKTPSRHSRPFRNFSGSGATPAARPPHRLRRRGTRIMVTHTADTIRHCAVRAVGCLLFAAAASACGGGEIGSVSVGEKAPVFSLANLRGDRVSLRDFRRGATLVNFWASWCDPCKKEMPLLNELHQSLSSSGVTIVGVS